MGIELDAETSFELEHYNDTYYIGANTKFKQIKVKIDTDSLKNNFHDIDGDEIIAVNIISLSYNWKKNGIDISNPADNDIINSDACNSATNYSYTLTIEGKAKARTKYGLPYESINYPFNQTYNIDANNGICYLRPYDMAINNGGTGISAISNQYDSTVFKPTSSYNETLDSSHHNGGFYYGTGFPTTAFKNTQFRIILSDNVYNANGYNFSIIGNPSQIDMQNNNQVIFKSKPENKTYYVKITKSANNFMTFYPIKLESMNSWFTGYAQASWTFTQWENGSKAVNGATNPDDYCG